MRRSIRNTVVAQLAAAALLVTGGSAVSAPPPPNVLQIDLSVDIDYVDPALAYYIPTWTIEYATCAKLLNYPDSPAPAGGRFRPEVAREMPTISADGRTYTFQVRDDFFFSPPSNERVTAAHFKWAIDRALNRQMSSPAQPFLDDIVGAADVIAGNANSVSGVVADGNTLAITLVRPAGDFLARLAMPFTCPLPLSVPVAPSGMAAPVPSAGPYYIAGWTRQQEILLRENPNYTGPRPHHFDEIHYGIGLPLETIKLRIDDGTTDWGDIPPAAHSELLQRFGPCAPGSSERQRYFCFPAPVVLYLAMNHDRPLFGDDPRTGPGLDPRGNVPLKQAVNFAIDRTAMLAQRGVAAGTTTDQHLPYGMPAFSDVALYPSTPDVARARQLAGWSPGDPIRAGVLYCSERAPSPAICQIVQTDLREIGLEMEIKLFPRATQFELAGRRGEPFDMTLEGWYADRYDPFDFFQRLDGTTLRPVNNTNFAYFNDPEYNSKIAAANLLVGNAREDAFGELDAEITRDAAPWAPYAVPNDRYYFSDRIGCQLYSPPYALNLAALCVRPALSVGDATAGEGDSGSRTVAVTISLAEAAPADYPVTVSYATASGTAEASDYEPDSGSVTFAAGETTKSIPVKVVGDTLDEPDEAFFVRLSTQSAGTIVRDTGVVTIEDDDAPPPPPPDTQAPTDPTVTSTSHRLGVPSADRTVDVAFSGATDDRSGVDGFSWSWTQQPNDLPDAVKDGEETATGTTSPPLDNGRWWFHLRTRDNAGNWTSTRHLGPFVVRVRPPCLVPNLRGKRLPQARRLLAARGCSLGRVIRAFSTRVPRGRVVDQRPRPGSRVARGTRVHVRVSKGMRRR